MIFNKTQKAETALLKIKMDVVSGAHVNHGHGGSSPAMSMNINSLGMGMGSANDGKQCYIAYNLVKYKKNTGAQ